MMWNGSRRMGLGGAAGALVGLGLFLVESLMAMRAGAIGLKLDLAGSLEPLMQAAKPQLPGLLVRVAIAYCLWGIVFGAVSAALASAFPIRGRRFWLLAGAEFALLSLLLTVHRAISRPALVDDLPMLRGCLEWLVNHAEPWHPAVAAAFWLILHAVLALRRLESRWVAWGALLAASATAWGLLLSRNPSSESRHPLVIVLGVDAMRPDRLGAYGGRANIAPNLETF
ncbi:MAG TPA: sulfatase, partial [Myxococcales bacterium]